ncbi:pentatricopeptide repeat-containing At2g36730 [Olea europaea subsp. europaea]|uniref:Pentatricopeptide repeat-containing At2g36730 n=2 Tax=Olea europaea subsp. europaea TaxID=158383 RepID=A0A8S0R5P6_OLEEU|nr:pentatricopeptide repeat-containing At2g36730 [Olea europaea subsp. europaea]
MKQRHCMVHMTLPTANRIHPPKPLNGNPKSVPPSLRIQQCLSRLTSFSSGKHIFQIHAQILISALHYDCRVVNRIIQFCCANHIGDRINLLHHARLIISQTQNLEVSSWNHLIRAYATSKCGLERETLRVFVGMRCEGVKPNEHTFPFVFKACASFSGFSEGQQIHGEVVKYGLYSNVYVQNTLIHMYGSCKKVVYAYNVFDKMLFRTVVSWNSIISAYVESSKFFDSVEVFVKMLDSDFEPDETTMVIVLSVCAELGNLSLGKWVHSHVIEKGMVLNCQLGTALVDMYGKCGALDYARLIFSQMVHRNVWTWSAMILGYAQHGFAKDALELFMEMKQNSVEPNYVTFLGVLCACSHSGLVEDGERFFYEMEHVYEIKPTLVHFGAMVDILGRAGHLKEAYTFLVNMPIEADAITWRTLLSACNIHDINDLSGVGEKVRQKLLELEPRRSGNFVMVANKYAEAGLWEKAANVRNIMRDKGLKRMAGESCLEVGGSIFRFFSGDEFKLAYKDMFFLLDRLNLHIKMIKDD